MKFMNYIMSVSERWASLRSDNVQEGREEEDAAATPLTGAPYATKGYRTPKLDPQCRLTANMDGHFLAELPKVGKKDLPTRPCRVCHKKGSKKRESRYFCKRCKIPLHPFPCFEKYHTLKDYTK